MKRKPKPLAARNPFVVLAMKRKAGTHRKPNKAIRRAEKVNLNGDVAQRQSIVASDGFIGRFRECFAPVA